MERRTFLTALGLAPAAIGTDAFLESSLKNFPQQAKDATRDKIAAALDGLAREVREGRAEVAKISVHSDIAPASLVIHNVTISLHYQPEDIS